jgi:hypothetical protein
MLAGNLFFVGTLDGYTKTQTPSNRNGFEGVCVSVSAAYRLTRGYNVMGDDKAFGVGDEV